MLLASDIGNTNLTLGLVGFALLAFRFAQVLWRLATGREAHMLVDEARDALAMREDGMTGVGK